MHLRTRLTTALALLATLSALAATLTTSAQSTQAPSAPSTQPTTQPTTPPPIDSLRALDGEWIFVEDITEGRALEDLTPPMSSKFSLGIEAGDAGAGGAGAGAAVVLNGHGSGHRNVRIALDGSTTEVTDQYGTARYIGTWKDSTFQYEVKFDRPPSPAGSAPGGIKMIRREFHMTNDGLRVRVAVDSDEWRGVGLYRHAEDIPPPTPHNAVIGDLAWIAGTWAGTRMSGSSIEERWSPPGGGAMLGISRTVNTKGRMSAFEFLRIVERDGGLIYIAQPGGAKGTEFVLTELTTDGGAGATRAVFDNPYHDFPNRIIYELSAEGHLTTSVGQLKGGSPIRIEFKREEK